MLGWIFILDFKLDCILYGTLLILWESLISEEEFQSQQTRKVHLTANTAMWSCWLMIKHGQELLTFRRFTYMNTESFSTARAGVLKGKP